MSYWPLNQGMSRLKKTTKRSEAPATSTGASATQPRSGPGWGRKEMGQEEWQWGPRCLLSTFWSPAGACHWPNATRNQPAKEPWRFYLRGSAFRVREGREGNGVRGEEVKGKNQCSFWPVTLLPLFPIYSPQSSRSDPLLCKADRGRVWTPPTASHPTQNKIQALHHGPTVLAQPLWCPLPPLLPCSLSSRHVARSFLS